MRVALIADTFPPLRTSGAVQLRDLSREFRNQGHEITVILPSSEIYHSWSLEDMEGVRILRLRAPKSKDVNYIRRAIAEFLMPFFMQRNLNKSPLSREQWDGVVWYSPSIFHGPLIRAIKLASKCKSYLIIRDIFPQWAADMGLMSKRGLIYLFFNTVARYQYSIADIIGVQTPGNLDYFKDWSIKGDRKLEVLQNWLFDTPIGECSISLSKTILIGRKVFVYAGNMGVAQGVGAFLDLAELLQVRLDVGFLFVGRGSDAEKLAEDARLRGLNNVLFYDEIHPDEIPGLYAQCAAGLVALDPRHKFHNIPGKFLTYMQAGLPVLARINSGNDLAEIIKINNVGRVSVEGDINSIEAQARELIDLLDADSNVQDRCKNLYFKLFTPEISVKQIIHALQDRAVAI
ncbi:MAG: glycosyltransferase family 4 protein [Polynucleobacter sp.]|nr:glycosyltransferase family 4 protein [Polynucleobacter sp.]